VYARIEWDVKLEKEKEGGEVDGMAYLGYLAGLSVL
jgi:hypothetical protein